MPLLTVNPKTGAEHFRRTVFRGQPGREKRLTFQAGQATEVSESEFTELSTDLGNGLVECRLDDKGKLRFVPPRAAPQTEANEVDERVRAGRTKRNREAEPAV